VVYATKLKAAGKPLPTTWASLPVWEMTAALLSFAAWAFALPNAPFSRYPWYSPPIAGFVVLLASTVLGLLAPLFQNPLGTGMQSTPGTGAQVAPGTGQQNSLDSGQDKPSERTTPAGG
jgi:hypothetical protein